MRLVLSAVDSFRARGSPLRLGRPQRHPQLPQQLAGLVVAVGAGHQGDVHALGLCKFVRVQLGKHQLFGQSEGVVAAAVEGVGVQAAKVRTRGKAMEISRSRNSHIRLPRSVTLQPMAFPSRSLKPAIDWRLRVTTGFWPAMVFRASTASSRYFFSPVALPTPMLMTIFCNRGSARRFVRPNCWARPAGSPSDSAAGAGAWE